MSGAVLSCRDLHKRYGERRAVSGVSFEIAPGETYGLLGPNGAGKTTTVSMICGLLAADEGQVAVGGRVLSTGSVKAKSAIGYVPQEIALYPDLTGSENLRFFGQLYGLRGQHLADRVDEVLEVVGLADRSREQVETYSGGMQRRLNIAAGLLHEPRLLVLDEPTVGVDPQSRNAILTNVEELAADGMAVLYTTHYMEEAERLCDRVGIIDEGRIVAEGTRRELVDRIGGRDRIIMTAAGKLEEFVVVAKRHLGIEEASIDERGVQFIATDGSHLLPKLLAAAADGAVDVTAVEVVQPDLEAVFLHLTGKALRD